MDVLQPNLSSQEGLSLGLLSFVLYQIKRAKKTLFAVRNDQGKLGGVLDAIEPYNIQESVVDFCSRVFGHL